MHPSPPTSIFRELLAMKNGVAKMFWATMACNNNLQIVGVPSRCANITMLFNVRLTQQYYVKL